jgi:hypothetical protein
LSITAQAFLFSAAFSADTPRYARIVVLLLGLTAVLAAMHLLAKHRYLESLHGQVEGVLGGELAWPKLYREELHALLKKHSVTEIGAARWRDGWRGKLVVDVQAFTVWMVTLGAFAVADTYLLIRALA